MKSTHGPAPAPTKTCGVHGGQMDEVPGFQAALLTLDHQHTRAGDDEEVLLAALAVVLGVALTGHENVDAEAELGPLLSPFEVRVLRTLLAAAHDASRALRTNHPSPFTTLPTSVFSSGAWEPPAEHRQPSF